MLGLVIVSGHIMTGNSLRHSHFKIETPEAFYFQTASFDSSARGDKKIRDRPPFPR